MSETIKARLENEIKSAMKAHDQNRRDALRLILAEVKRVEVDERIEVDDSRMLTLLSSMIKKRNDSISQYKDANRLDLAEKEEYEIKVIQEFLPAQLSQDEIEKLVKESITKVDAKSIKDMGKVMNDLKPNIQGRADMGVVSNKIKQLLAG